MIAALPARVKAAAALGVAAVAGVAVLWSVDPNSASSPLPGCLFFRFTGLYCPGCGMTRMLHALVHGDLATAASMNLLAFMALPVFAAIVANELAERRLLRGRLAAFAYNGPMWIAAAVVFGVLRNLPFAPFSALAPG